MALRGSYKELIERLFSINSSQLKQGLDNMKLLNAVLGYPAANIEKIHVAGSNGKGSVCWKLASSLTSNGHSTGLFVSPHINTYRERVQVNGEYISERQVEKLLPAIFDAASEHSIHPSFFEYTTALALMHFHASNVDCIVFETGLGGEWDSTNVICPDMSVVTSISLEHTAILGDSTRQIASAKAGIIKPGTPYVIGSTVEPMDIFVGSGEDVGSLKSSKKMMRDTLSPLNSKDYNIENSNTTLNALEHFPKLYSNGLSRLPLEISYESIYKSVPPCRYERLRFAKSSSAGQGYCLASEEGGGLDHCFEVILDAAHNPEGIEKLLNRFVSDQSVMNGDVSPHFHAIMGFAPEKNIQACISPFLAHCSRSNIHFAQASNVRALSVESLQDMFEAVIVDGVAEETVRDSSDGATHRNRYFHDLKLIDASLSGDYAAQSPVHAAIYKAFELSQYDSHQYGTIVPTIICGSIFLLSDVRRVLGISIASDD